MSRREGGEEEGGRIRAETFRDLRGLRARGRWRWWEGVGRKEEEREMSLVEGMGGGGGGAVLRKKDCNFIYNLLRESKVE